MSEPIGIFIGLDQSAVTILSAGELVGRRVRASVRRLSVFWRTGAG